MLIEQIKNRKFLEESINELKKTNPKADIQLLEKTIGALYLVESLVNSGLNFVFKGGTSLVLLLNEIKRFSVDVDIITEEDKQTVNECIKRIIESQNLFTKYEENKRNNSASKRMELEHYKFFFNSVTDNSEKYILLDIAYESNKYPETINKNIECLKLNVSSEYIVNLPSIESILGDKLTVLAPNTTGIHYNSDKELELMKQLYDVDKLFNEAEYIDIVKKSFINISNREIKYRKLKEITNEDVLEDIRDFCIDTILQNNIENQHDVNIGMKKLQGFIIENKFRREQEVLTAVGKVLYLMKLIKNDENKIERYSKESKLKDIIIPEKFKKILKKMNNYNEEAYYYILKSFE